MGEGRVGAQSVGHSEAPWVLLEVSILDAGGVWEQGGILEGERCSVLLTT